MGTSAGVPLDPSPARIAPTSATAVAAAPWARVSELIGERLGLHFPHERWPDMQRGLAGAAVELGLKGAAACADWLVSAVPTKAHLQVLAGHLTVGETYFFREKATFDVLAGSILPDLIRSRQNSERRLRIWSAACCTGEEPYSLAMLLDELLPDPRGWHVTIRATDINGGFLRKAAAGVYGEWSFRQAPARLKERYFERTKDGRYAILPEIRRRVTFAHLNLVEDVFPSLETDTNAMDLILCRNVLMYFTPAQVGKVIGNLHRALLDGGWLAVSLCEASSALFPQFLAVNATDAILYQKSDALPGTGPQRSSIRGGQTPEPAAFPPQAPHPAASQTPPASAPERAPEAAAFPLRARSLANQGKLVDALLWCDRWIAADKVDPAAHYLRAVVLLEQGEADEARASLQRAIYLRPGLVLAHFALGNVARARGKSGEAKRHFANALHLLAGHRPDDLLPESDGLTAGRLTETITATIGLEPVS